MKRKPSRKKPTRVAATKNLTARHRTAARRVPLFNILAVILVWLATVALFYSGPAIRQQQLVVGQQAPETVVAATDFFAETVSATELKKREAADRVLPVYSIETPEIDRARQALEKLEPRLRALREAAGQPEQAALIRSSITDLLDIFSIPLTPDDLLGMTPVEPLSLKTAILDPLGEVVRNGIIAEGGGPEHVAVRSKGATETIRNLDSFLTRDNGLKKAVGLAMQRLPEENRNEEVLRRLMSPWIKPNVIRDDGETALRRAQARELTEPVIEPVDVGTLLVRAGDPITEQTLRWLEAHEKRLGQLETLPERIQRIAGGSLLLLIGLALVTAIAGIIDPHALNRRKETLLLLTLTFLALLTGKALLFAASHRGWLSPSLLQAAMPLALAPILAAVLLGKRAGLIGGIWTAFALAILCGNSFHTLTAGLATTLTAVYATRDVKRRAALFRAGVWTGAAHIVVILTLALLNRPAWTVLLPQLATALLSGMTAALVALLLIPLFEHLFNVTTDITLLELSDLSHPLLQSLAINAPGTYHHSLMMASLAQNAAEAIGANGLLLRVCAYFHDIGKLVKPGFFSENIQYTENPHDGLSPSMSTIVIVSHIKEGVTLAKKYRLPQVIIDGIEQHQGTSLVTVFYHRAKTLQKKDPAGSQHPLNDEDYRYEGPRPQNREMAVLMLADSCEAASRSLDKPTPVRIAGLINDIFDSRLRDGQLDECTLTLADLHRVKESFIFTLTNMLHGRVAYPKDENNGKNPAEKTPAESGGSEAAVR